METRVQTDLQQHTQYLQALRLQVEVKVIPHCPFWVFSIVNAVSKKSSLSHPFDGFPHVNARFTECFFITYDLENCRNHCILLVGRYSFEMPKDIVEKSSLHGNAGKTSPGLGGRFFLTQYPDPVYPCVVCPAMDKQTIRRFMTANGWFMLVKFSVPMCFVVLQ